MENQALLPRKKLWFWGSTLQTKILQLLGLFFIFAFTIITLSLYLARQLEGNGAAINDVGSLRMRSYAIGLHLHQYYLADALAKSNELNKIKEINKQFINTLNRLQNGDIQRPLFLPNDKNIQEQMSDLRYIWLIVIEKKIDNLLNNQVENKLFKQSLVQLTFELDQYVGKIDNLVSAVEYINARYTRYLYFFQNILVAFSLFGTLLLAYLFTRLISEPLKELTKSMTQMSNAQFEVRVQVHSHDEIGQLATGFNKMANHLQELYLTLEQRVEEKTASLAIKNKELATLYETTTLLSKPNQIDGICQGVLENILVFLQAEAGVVRLLDDFSSDKQQKLQIIAHYGMSEDFLRNEEKINFGDCLCGMSAENCSSKIKLISKINNKENIKVENNIIFPPFNCSKFALVAAFPIILQQRSIGLFTIFLANKRVLTPNEIKLVESVGSHLAIYLENLRLINYAKELAIYEERNMLAQELHDSIAQSLAFLNIQAQILSTSIAQQEYTVAQLELDKIKEAIKESYDMVRELLSHFRLRVQHDGLDIALESTLRKFQEQTGIDCHFHNLGNKSPPASGGIIQLLHVVQEAISNIRKHANATRVDLKLDIDENGSVFIELSDNGVGFAVNETLEKDGFHVGLSIMRERINKLNGIINISSCIGHGCIGSSPYFLQESRG